MTRSDARVLRFATLPESRWANGAGTTVELDRAPATQAAGFGWRVSVATVDSPGPFSALPGIDRTIIALGPAALELTTPEGSARIEPFSAMSFAGEDAVGVPRISAPSRDLNVMTRRGEWRHEAEIRFGGSFTVRSEGPVLIVALDGTARIGDIELEPLDALSAPAGDFTVGASLHVAVLRLVRAQ